jgi:Xaa-Pro aminopeptidase
MKIKEFQEVLKEKKIDFFLAANIDFARFDYDMAYFSGYGGVGVLIIPKDKKPFMIVNRMEAKRARADGLKVYSPKSKKRLSEFTNEILKKNKIKGNRVGINKEDFTLLLKDVFKSVLKKCRFVDLRKDLYNIREVKTNKEIEIIRKGCKISDSILANCFNNFGKFKKESEVKAFLEYEARKKGCELAFPTIVASGVNACKAHHHTEDTKLKKGFCVIDFGIRYMNYCTDTTRTVYIGKPSKKEVEIYNMLLGVQKNAISEVKLGLKCYKLFDNVKKGLGDYAKYFTHGLGHGFGIKIHEFPNLTDGSKHKVKENMVFTIEPGIYLNNFGMRIEDDVLVTKKKVEVLTKIKKGLIILDY